MPRTLPAEEERESKVFQHCSRLNSGIGAPAMSEVAVQRSRRDRKVRQISACNYAGQGLALTAGGEAYPVPFVG